MESFDFAVNYVKVLFFELDDCIKNRDFEKYLSIQSRIYDTLLAYEAASVFTADMARQYIGKIRNIRFDFDFAG